MAASARSRQIAVLNDLARTAMGVAGRVVQTDGINALPPATQSAIREQVERFNAWTADNDPHGEHDFGAFAQDDVRVFWKIDYYDAAMQVPAAKTRPTPGRPRAC